MFGYWKLFRVKSGFYQSTRRLPEPPGELDGPYGPWWKREEAAHSGPRAPPLPWSELDKERGPAPLSLFPPPQVLFQLGLGGDPTPRGSRTLLARPMWPASLPPFGPLYTEAEAP